MKGPGLASDVLVYMEGQQCDELLTEGLVELVLVDGDGRHGDGLCSMHVPLQMYSLSRIVVAGPSGEDLLAKLNVDVGLSHRILVEDWR